MQQTQTTFLDIKNLTVQYTSEGQVIHAVNEVTFSLDRAKTIGLVGETGAGKTSIAKAILRVLQEPAGRICDGEVLLEGQDLLKLSEPNMRKIRGSKISMIFQDPMTALNPVLKVGDQIAEVIKIHDGLPKHEAREKAEKMLEMVGIPALRYDEYPLQFSGGMKQRVVIAMALACSPQLLLADEPTTALDVTIQAQVLDMIKKLKDDYQTSMILITHDLGVVAEVCDDVAIVYAGEIIEYGSLEEIFDHPSHPYTIGLFHALPDIDGDVERLQAIDGMPPDSSCLPGGCKFHPRCPYVSDACKERPIELRPIAGRHTCRCINPPEQER